MDTQSSNIALRKRTQIASANRVMFAWVAGVSVIFGFALVASIFLTKLMFFNEKVLQEKSKTIATLSLNNKNISKLEQQVRVLNTNQALISSMAEPDAQAVQVVLDALPSDANSPALGASIQTKLVGNIPGLILETFQINPVAGIESLSTSGSSIDASTSGSSDTLGEITFALSVYGTDDALRQLLTNFERSIRTIHVTSLKFESHDELRALTINAKAFYQPKRVIELKDKTVKE